MSKYTRSQVGALILADRSAVREYVEKKQQHDRIECLAREIDTLKQQIAELQTTVLKLTKSE
jgi:predicted transcriptional regulator